MSLAACSPKPVEQAPIRKPGNLAADAYPPRGWTTSPIPPEDIPVQSSYGEEPFGRLYGVASPPRVARAEVLIVPERQPMQAWFPVINALLSRGYTVWIVDPRPAPLSPGDVRTLRDQVIRKGSTDRLFVLGQGRGAVAAMAGAQGALGVVLWSPLMGSGPYVVPEWEMKAMRGLGLGKRQLLGQAEWKEGQPAGDPLAQAWMKANPSLRPVPPTYNALYAYERQAGIVKTTPRGIETIGVQFPRTTPPVWISAGDAAARAACAASSVCRPVAPGIEPMIAVFDEATKEVTLGAPPPPPGKKRKPPSAA